MIWRPPRSTRTDTHFPDPTLFRTFHAGAGAHLRVPDVVFEGRRLFQPAGANRDVADVADLVRAAQSLLLLPLHRTSLGLAGGRKSVRLGALRGHSLSFRLRGRDAHRYRPHIQGHSDRNSVV